MAKHNLVTCCIVVLLWGVLSCDENSAREPLAQTGDDGTAEGNGTVSDADSDMDADGDADGDPAADPTEDCVLSGDVGLEVGTLAQNITLYECDGTPALLHNLVCDSPYTFLYSYAGW
jgi:hypothetical protein